MDVLGKFDVKGKIEELVKKLQSDETLREQFKKDPVKAAERLLGVDLPDDVLQKIVAGVKAKLGADKAADLLNTLGGLLGKKD